MIVDQSCEVPRGDDHGNRLGTETNHERERESDRRIPGTDIGPNLEIDRGAIEKDVRNDGRDGKRSSTSEEPIGRKAREGSG